MHTASTLSLFMCRCSGGGLWWPFEKWQSVEGFGHGTKAELALMRRDEAVLVDPSGITKVTPCWN